MAGQSAFFKKSRRAGKSASFHIILKYGGAICFLKKIKEDKEFRIHSHYIKIWRGNPLSLKNQGGQGNPHSLTLY